MMSKSSFSQEIQQNVDTSDTPENNGDSDLIINGLIYEMPRALSLRTERCHKKHYPQQQTYSVSRSTTIVFELNSGNAYGDLQNSYLRFKMRAVGPAAVAPCTFGAGSALNLIREIRVLSRSGTELYRLERCNLYNFHRLNYSKTDRWKDTIGSAFFLDSATPIFSNGNTLVSEVSIPLCELGGIFRPMQQGQTMPPHLLSGLRIELTCESLASAFVDTAGYLAGAASVQLEDMFINLCQINLSDESSKLISLEASQTGLEWVYPRVYSNSQTYPAGTNSITSQMTKAVSQATGVFAVLQNNTNVSLTTADSFLSRSFDVTAWNYRLGSSYYPHQQVISKVDASVSNKGVESYLLTMSAFDKMQNSFQESGVTSTQYSTNKSVLAVDIQRDSSLQLSGVPVNNSRSIELLCERNGSSDGVDKLDLTLFLQYVSVAKAYIDNVAVSI